MTNDSLSSFKNHIQISYGEGRTAHRQTPEDQCNIGIGSTERPIVEWRAELNLAAVQIQGLFQKSPILYVDGSFASQLMVQGFRWAVGTFTCVVPKFKKDLNLPAFSQTIVFLESIDAPYEVVEIDFEELMTNPETLAWSQKYSTDLPSHLVGMKVWQILAERRLPVIFPMGLPQFRKTADGWKVLEYERDYGLFQFQRDQKCMGVSCFFKWAPETVLSFLTDPTLRKLMTNVRKEASMTEKVLKEIFQNYFQIAGEKDWTGFEKVDFTVKRFHQTAKAAQPAPFTAYAIPFADYSARLMIAAAPENFNPTEAATQSGKVHLG
jgi:hypothetical protein